MKNKLFIFIPIFLFVLVLTVSGCSSEPTYTAKKWEEVESQEEVASAKIEQDSQKEQFEKTKSEIQYFLGKYYSYNSECRDITSRSAQTLQDVENSIEALYDFGRNLNTLTIPKPLDDFYDMVIERNNYDLDICYLFKNSLNGNVFDENKFDNYFQKTQNLAIEINRELREVLREYNLE